MTIGAWVGMGVGLAAFLITLFTIAVKLSASFTELNTTMRMLSETFKAFSCGNKEEHDELYAKTDAHEVKLENHEARIGFLENKPPRKRTA